MADGGKGSQGLVPLGMPVSSAFIDQARIGNAGRVTGLERIVRPFQTVETKMPDPPTRVIEITLEGEDGEAALVWGGPSDFSLAPAIEDAEADGLVDKLASGGGGITVRITDSDRPGQEQNPQDDKLGTIAFNMMDAQAERGKIYNPDDKEQWVEMLRIKSIRFRGSLPVAIVEQRQAPRRPQNRGINRPFGDPPSSKPPTRYRMEKVILKLNFKWPKWPQPPA
jgi:hypothetical protein